MSRRNGVHPLSKRFIRSDDTVYARGIILPDCPIHASSFQSTIPVSFPVPPPATATPGIGAMPRPATARPVTQLGEAAVPNASDGQSGSLLAAPIEDTTTAQPSSRPCPRKPRPPRQLPDPPQA